MLNALYGPSATRKAAIAWRVAEGTIDAWCEGKRHPSARARLLILASLEQAPAAIDQQTARQLELMRQHGEDRKISAEAYRLAFANRHRAIPHKIYNKPDRQWIKP